MQGAHGFHLGWLHALPSTSPERGHLRYHEGFNPRPPLYQDSLPRQDPLCNHKPARSQHRNACLSMYLRFRDFVRAPPSVSTSYATQHANRVCAEGTHPGKPLRRTSPASASPALEWHAPWRLNVAPSLCHVTLSPHL